MVVVGDAATAETAAFVSSGPPWQVEQWPLPVKTDMPSCACLPRAEPSPARKRSTGLWPETSVASYSCTARPQKSEKFSCMSVYSFAASGPSCVGTNERLLSGLTRTRRFDFHHCGANAFWVRSAYDTESPLPAGLASGPSTPSDELTDCSPSGLSDVSFLPTSGNVRPPNDMIPAFVTGPTACDASAAFCRSIFVAVIWSAPVAWSTRPPSAGPLNVSSLLRFPNGSTPLKSFCALPSHWSRELKPALITV